MTRLRQIAALYTLCIVGCAVEAGNPNTDKDAGTVKITIAGDEQSESDGTELNLTGKPRLKLFVESVQLRGFDEDDEEISADLQPAASDVEVFELDEALLVAESGVAVGTYHTIVVVLNQETPFHYLPDGTSEKPLRFDEQGLRAISISQDFEVVKGEEEEIVIEFDAGNSIQAQDGEFVFKPRIKPHRKRLGVRYEGVLERDDGLVVCAYLYNPWIAEALKKAGKRERRPPQVPSAGSVLPKVFETKNEVVYDEDLSCENAFRKTKVREDGTYRFGRLAPGKYTFRAFYADETFADVADDVELAPPAKKLRIRRGLRR